MAELVKGQVVVVAFPYSDLSSAKKRPALLISNPDGSGDVVLCQITSRSSSDEHSIKLTSKDFTDGHLPVDSFIRSNKLFTAHQSIILNAAGQITSEKYQSVIGKIVELISI